ncbi:MAG: OmpA family protein [Alphaproteobacteria bacterium]|nr:OmpA family protein [Alphaproteobacteria bacterium]
MIKQLIIASTLIFTGAHGALAQNADVDKNTIIRSLAPIEYLPQHKGTARAIDLDIEFRTGSVNLTSRAKRQLNIVSEALRDPKLAAERFQIVGHTDASGRAAMNMKLSERRARAVFDYLILKGGIHKDRLVSSGKGETRLKNPMAPNSGENRRVEFILLQSNRDKTNRQNKPGTEKVIKW